MGAGGNDDLLVLRVHVLHQSLAVRGSNYLIIFTVKKDSRNPEFDPLLKANLERVILRAELTP